MNFTAARLNFFLLILITAGGCANIVPPSGGEKDVRPPRLLKVSPADSGLNVRNARIRFDFDEYISLADPGTQVIISPLLAINPTVTALGKHITVQFPDSLLLANTTYRITLGTAVRDLNENNIYTGRGYIFSTGGYFDSLSISGTVTDAMTGLPDTAATILLYNQSDGDSAVVKRRPLYATHVNAAGGFLLQGLPSRRFAIYALRDKNANLIFDDRAEWIGFHNTPVYPGNDSNRNIVLRTFPLRSIDTAKVESARPAPSRSTVPIPVNGVGYTIDVDTTDTKKRSQDITKPLSIDFALKPSAFDKDKIFLTWDSSGITTEAAIRITSDTLRPALRLSTGWAENALYTLRLQKGFAKDTAGKDYLPGRYTFRTKWADDYARLGIHLPSRYFGAGYVLQVSNGQDTIYKQPVLDSNVALIRIPPGNYKMLIIVDENKNGIWDTGDLFGKKQPERVVPFGRSILLKPGWENQQDFEPAAEVPASKSPKKTTSPLNR